MPLALSTSPRLVTIPISHFCERARWTLEYLQLPFRERPVLQMFHRRTLRKIGAGTTTPALRLADRVLSDSYEISDWANAQENESGRRLRFWTSQTVESETLVRWGETLACWTRIIAYHWLLPRRGLLMRYNNRGAPRWQGWMLGLGYHRAVEMVRSHFGITEQRVLEVTDQLLGAMDALEKELGDAPYMKLAQGSFAGDKFSELDLTLASYLGPVCLPQEYGIKSGSLPSPCELSEEQMAQVERFRTHPIGAHCLRMYRSHRRA